MADTRMLVHFTFCADRESDSEKALQLFVQCFPELQYGSAIHAARSRGVRITCSADEFVYWLYLRDQAGFVNRVRQLNMSLSECVTKPSKTSGYQTIPKGSMLIKPQYYCTQKAEAIRKG